MRETSSKMGIGVVLSFGKGHIDREREGEFHAG